MNNVHVVFHKNCYDGYGVAWAVKQKYPDAKMFPCQHGEEVPVFPKDADVIIGDFSFSRDVLTKMRDSVNSLVVLDHHKTAEAALAGLDFVHFNMDKSGAVLVWEYLFPDRPVPKLLQYIQDRDLWLHRLENSKAVVAYIYTQPMEMATFDGISAILEGREGWPDNFASLVDAGNSILAATQQMVDVMANNSWMAQIGGHTVPVTNASVFFSEVAGALCERNPECPFAAYYFDRKDGTRQWGLRARKGFDVSEIAKMYGGGGHAGAAGFQTKAGEMPQ